MHKTIRRFLSTMLLLLCHTILFAQNNTDGSDTLMRSNGKIYVVVAVCLTILLGLFFYVFTIDRKISRIEREQ
jgi:hypothetical protein